MDVKIEKSWKLLLDEEFNKDYFKDLIAFLKEEYKSNICFPPGQEIFAAFNYCNFNDVKVVIIGQDPYHDIGQAHGLCFSVNEKVSHPPSLKNIFKEMSADLEIQYPTQGNLTHWANQGVLLLNAILTVKAHQAGSHQGKGWEQFTDAVISNISRKKKNVIFLLWGGYAKRKTKLINEQNHFILTSGHPSPLSANRGYWFGNKHFSKTNSLLEKVALTKIDWKLP